MLVSGGIVQNNDRWNERNVERVNHTIRTDKQQKKKWSSNSRRISPKATGSSDLIPFRKLETIHTRVPASQMPENPTADAHGENNIKPSQAY